MAPANTPTDTANLARGIAGAFERRPADLEKQPMLRVHDFGFLRMDAEEGGVEAIRVLQDAAGRHIVPAASSAPATSKSGLGKLRVVEERDALLPRDQIGPELLDAVGAGEPSGHADDGDAFVGFVRSIAVLLQTWSASWPAPASGAAARSRTGVAVSAQTPRRAQVVRQRTHGRMFEQRHDREIRLRALSRKATVHLHEQQRVPAQIEEVLLDADAVEAEHPLPHTGDRLFQSRSAEGRSSAIPR